MSILPSHVGEPGSGASLHVAAVSVRLYALPELIVTEPTRADNVGTLCHRPANEGMHALT